MSKKKLADLEIDTSTPTAQPAVPLDWQGTLNLNKSITKGRFLQDADGNLLILPTMPVAYGQGAKSTVVQGDFPQGLLNPVAGTYEYQRTPTSWHQNTVTTGAGGLSWTVWTPTTGKKFRLLGCIINVSNDVAEAALDTGICLRDNAVTIGYVAFTIPAIAVVTVAGGISIPINFGENGYLSVAVNNTFNIGTISAQNLTAGRISCIAWGTEE